MHQHNHPLRRVDALPPQPPEAPPPVPPVFVRARVVCTQTRERRALVRAALGTGQAHHPGGAPADIP